MKLRWLFSVTFVVFSVALAVGSDIVVRTDIPFGNAANVRVMQENSVPTVRFAAHPHGGPESLWFCFRVSKSQTNNEPLGAVRMVLESSENMLGGGRPDRFRPVFRFAGGEWERAGVADLINLADGRQEAAWTVQVSTASFDSAFSYPYGGDEVSKLLEDTKGYWRMDTIGVSQGGRPLSRLSNDYGLPKGERPGVYLLARQHSGEVSGSWVLDGLLRRLAELGDKAPLVWVVPLANIDGIEQGDYGKDNFPYDLNRAWGNPPMRHEVLVFQRDMRRWSQRCRPIGCFDFHAPGGSDTDGIFAYLGASERFPDVATQATTWIASVGEALGKDFAAEKFIRTANYKSRWETPRFVNFCMDELRVPGVTLEIPYAMNRSAVMTRQDYQEAGKRIADVLVERVQGTK